MHLCCHQFSLKIGDTIFHLTYLRYFDTLRGMLLSSQKRVEISRDEFDENNRPAVYEVFKDGVRLYVGYGARGFTRVYSANDPVRHLGRYLAFQNFDSIRVTFFDDQRSAAEEEGRLIHAYHPQYNANCHVCGSLKVLQPHYWPKRPTCQRTEHRPVV